MIQNNINFNNPGKKEDSRVSQHVIKVLQAFCKRNGFIRCQKLSQSGMVWNERILYVSDTYFAYYNVLKVFDETKFKQKVRIIDIEELSEPGKSESSQVGNNCITIKFQSRYCVNYREVNKSVKPTNKPEQGHILWMIKFDPRKCDPFANQVQAIQQNQNLNATQVIKQEPPQNKPKMQQSMQQPQKEPSQAFQSNATFDPNKQRKSPNMYLNQIIMNHNKRSRKREQQVVDDKKRRMRIKWDYRFDKFWEEYYREVPKENPSLKTEVEYASTLFALIGEFRKCAAENVKNIIEELIYPVKMRTYLEVRNNHPMYQFKNKNELAYLVDGIFIRVAYINVFPVGSKDLRTQKDSSQNKNQKKDNFLEKDDSKQQNENKQTEVFHNLEWKMIAHEFRSNDIIADSIHQLILQSDEPNIFSLRIPLTCQIDYLGFTCLCSSVAPLLLVLIIISYLLKSLVNLFSVVKPPMRKSDKAQYQSDLNNLIKSERNANNLSLIHGLKRNGEYLEYESPNLKQDLELLGYHLRLKPFQVNGMVEKTQKPVDVYLSLFSEVHCLKNSDLIRNDIMHEVKGESLYDKEKRLKILKSKQKKSDKSDIQEHKKFYLMKTATIFPLEIDVEDNNKQIDLFQNRLRPEFLCMIGCYLSNGAFLNQNSLINTDVTEILYIFFNQSILNNKKQDDLFLASAGLKLKNDAINNLLRDLENMVIQPIGTEQLSKYFHLYGVNMRHLGKVASRTDLPHIKEICMTDMIARSTKKILRANLAKFILYNYGQTESFHAYQYFQELNRIIKDGQDDQGDNDNSNDNQDDDDEDDYQQQQQSQNQSDDVLYKKQVIYEEELEFQLKFDEQINQLKSEIKKDFHEVLQSIIIDYLNLIFTVDSGTSKESSTFWNDILTPQIEQDFNYTVTDKQAMNISTGYLLHAISYHWRVSFVQDEIKIFNFIPPFDNNKLAIRLHSKVYQYRSLKINQTIDEYREVLNAGQYDLAIKYMTIKKKFLELIDDKHLTAPAPTSESALVVEIANAELLKIAAKNKQLLNEQQKKNSRQRRSPSRKYSPSNIYQQKTQSLKNEEIDEKSLYRTLETNINNVFKEIPLNHAQRIKPMTTLIQIYTAQSNGETNMETVEKKHNDCMDTYQKIQQLIEYHLGNHHPLTADLYALQSDYHFLVGKNEQGQKYLQEAIKKCKAILGGNHVKISDLYQKQAQIFLNLSQSQKALQFFELSKSIIESQFGPESIDYGKISYEISIIYFSTANLQMGIQLCKQAYQIFYQRGEKFLTQSINCCYQCCKAALNLLQPKEVIEYAEKIWEIIKQQQDEKKLKRSQRMFYIEFILQALIKIIVLSLKSDERNFLFCILLFYTMKTGPLRTNTYISEDKSATINSFSNVNMEENPPNIDVSSLTDSPGLRDREKNSFDLNLDDGEMMIDNSQNQFEEFREKYKQLRISNDEDLVKRVGLYPDNRIFNPEDLFQKYDKTNSPDAKKKKKDLFEQLTKDSYVSSIDILKNMFNEILSKKDFINQKDFFVSFRKFISKVQDQEKLESLEMYKTFIEIFGNLFFYDLFKSTIYTKYKILDYDQK